MTDQPQRRPTSNRTASIPETDREPDRAVLIQAEFPEDDRPVAAALDELESLAVAAGGVVVGEIQQKRRSPDRATFIGSGRLEDAKVLCQEQEATLVIVGHDLSPAQGRNLEGLLEMRVVDRSQLIMDLFALRARTHQARLQVELAQLEYSLPRLRRMWTHLDRYKGGIGMRGPGETQIEVDRREIRRKIRDRNRRLEGIERHHQLQRRNRAQYATVGLLGYTNAGKSTLFNTLTSESVVAENRVFSTLDTRTRQWRVTPHCTVLLSDTVGFIHNLPHHLIASFQATLAEAIEADLLLHVIDGSHPDAHNRVESVEHVLRHVGAADRPRIRVVNKADAALDPVLLGSFGDQSVVVSARSGDGLEPLAEAVRKVVQRDVVEVSLIIPLADGASLAAVEAHGQVLTRETTDTSMQLHAMLSPALAGRLRAYVVDSLPQTEEPA